MYVCMSDYVCLSVCLSVFDLVLKQHTFSFSEPSSFLSSLFFNLPGASAIGKDEWKTKSFPEIPAACEKTTLLVDKFNSK